MKSYKIENIKTVKIYKSSKSKILTYTLNNKKMKLKIKTTRLNRMKKENRLRKSKIKRYFKKKTKACRAT